MAAELTQQWLETGCRAGTRIFRTRTCSGTGTVRGGPPSGSGPGAGGRNPASPYGARTRRPRRDAFSASPGRNRPSVPAAGRRRTAVEFASRPHHRTASALSGPTWEIPHLSSARLSARGTLLPETVPRFPSHFRRAAAEPAPQHATGDRAQGAEEPLLRTPESGPIGGRSRSSAMEGAQRHEECPSYDRPPRRTPGGR
jgi:hypothetical protein